MEEKDTSMTKNINRLECLNCKIRDQFYEDFNNDTNKNVSYFGMQSYIDYCVVPSQEETSKNYRSSNIRFLQLLNEWTVRDLIAKQVEQKNGTIGNHLKFRSEPFPRDLREKKRKLAPRPPFYSPQSMGNLIVPKPDSFSVLPPDDTVCSDRSPSKGKLAPKKPKICTLKRNICHFPKLASKESYEHDLFEEKKFICHTSKSRQVRRDGKAAEGKSRS